MNLLIVLIPVLPLIAFIVLLFIGKKRHDFASYFSIACISLSSFLSFFVFFKVVSGQEFLAGFEWVVIGNYRIQMGFQIDSLAALMLVVVSIVATLIQIYSRGYMHGDIRFNWYYAALSLFTASMLSLVIADNYLQLYISWELVGLCSYLLIGFWFEKEEAHQASKKAFIVTRIGDAGFFIGIMTLFTVTGSFGFQNIFEAAEAMPLITVTAASILIFCGAIGKSAQFPLHVWLPDAMAGPTPVSALIHAATMVAAGVYLVARSFPLFHLSATAMSTVAIIGTITALMAATIALVAEDIKKILAYSTISQLGYMIFALGVGGYTAGVFHLMTHAFFKALLFLGAGSVIHATHTQNIKEMGGLGRSMKITSATFIIASLSIAGVFPLAGFWSKDEILLDSFASGNYLIFTIGELTAFLTAFYMFRLCFVVFFGEEKGHSHESPANMTWPLMILAFLSITAGLVNTPLFGNWFGRFVSSPYAHHAEPSWFVIFISSFMALFGIYMAYLVYYRRVISLKSIKRVFSLIYNLLANKYYFDEIYNFLFVIPVIGLSKGLAIIDLYLIDGIVNGTSKLTVLSSKLSGIFDLFVIDGIVNGVSGAFKITGREFRKIQAGYIQSYAILMMISILMIIVFFVFRGG